MFLSWAVIRKKIPPAAYPQSTLKGTLTCRTNSGTVSYVAGQEESGCVDPGV